MTNKIKITNLKTHPHPQLTPRNPYPKKHLRNQIVFYYLYLSTSTFLANETEDTYLTSIHFSVFSIKSPVR